MSELADSAGNARDELEAIYQGSADGILIGDLQTHRFVRANPAICAMLGYTEAELLSLTLFDVVPPERMTEGQKLFEAVCRGATPVARGIPFVGKNGRVFYADGTAMGIVRNGVPCVIGFFHDVTEQRRIMEQLVASEARYRLITDNVADVIWTVTLPPEETQRFVRGDDATSIIDDILNRWRFSFVSPAIERIFGYTVDEARGISIRTLASPEAFLSIREALIEQLVQRPPSLDAFQYHVLEVELRAKDGAPRWCEVVSTYLHNEYGAPTGFLGITRDVSARREAQRALLESECMLRTLVGNMPDMVFLVDCDATIHFANHDAFGVSRDLLLSTNGLQFAAPAERDFIRATLANAFRTSEAAAFDARDIHGRCWNARIIPLATEGDPRHAMIIATDVTEERLATEALEKERRLLRQLLELHESERRLAAYDIHDGFAQQLTGALFRLQGLRDVHARDPGAAWKALDAATALIARSVNEARRLISGLRPPILDEDGVVAALEYLACEQTADEAPTIEFEHDVAFKRLAPPLETAIFRVVQESLNNACRHSRSDRIHVTLSQADNRIRISVQDWGVGFDSTQATDHHFGLQGMRERVRLLGGHIVIDSSPGVGTRIDVELPLILQQEDLQDKGITP
jgi:PAS domain S-box-containing protein